MKLQNLSYPFDLRFQPLALLAAIRANRAGNNARLSIWEVGVCLWRPNAATYSIGNCVEDTEKFRGISGRNLMMS